MIQIGYVSDKCDQYLVDGEYRVAIRVVGPLRVISGFNSEGREIHDVILGCNLYYYCENIHCEYSRVSRDARKRARAERQQMSSSSLGG